MEKKNVQVAWVDRDGIEIDVWRDRPLGDDAGRWWWTTHGGVIPRGPYLTRGRAVSAAKKVINAPPPL